MTLQEHMITELEEGWTEAIPEAWRPIFEDVVPNFRASSLANIQHGPEDERAFPRLQAADNGAHLFRCFDGIAPRNVRTLVLGQDPYPNRQRATGRAFEDAIWNGPRSEELANSVKPLILAAWASKEGENALFKTGGWQELISAHDFRMPAQHTFFGNLANQGVLFMNAAWTYTRKTDQKAHLDLWRPVVHQLFQSLSQMQQPIVFLLMGSFAQKALCASDPAFRNSAIVDSAHPRSSKFYDQTNPFTRVNGALEKLGAQDERINWWPNAENRV